MDIVNIIAALGGWELVRFVLNYLFYRRREGEPPAKGKADQKVVTPEKEEPTQKKEEAE